MPIADCGFVDGDQGSAADLLELYGPTIPIDIGLDPDYEHGVSTNIPTPAIERVPALVDMGASESCIDAKLAEEIGLPIVDVQTISGVGGHHEVNVYLAHIYAPTLNTVQYGRFAGVDLADGGQVHRALIGRSLWRDVIMFYDGGNGLVTIAR